MKTVFLLKPKSSKIKWYGMQLTHRMKSMRVEKKKGGGSELMNATRLNDIPAKLSLQNFGHSSNLDGFSNS